MTQLRLENAVYLIGGYYLPRPQERDNQLEQAFDRAKAELLENLKRQIEDIEATSYEQFSNKPRAAERGAGRRPAEIVG